MPARWLRTVNKYQTREQYIEAFWKKVDNSGDCWTWLACRDPRGYGRLNFMGKPTLAHRLAFELTNGSIPDGLCVLHRCDNPPCCNPDHLFLGTRTDNAQDRTEKGRQAKGDEVWKHQKGRIARGDRCGYRLHPERYPRGEMTVTAKLDEAKVREIRRRFAEGERNCDLSLEYGVSRSCISAIVNRDKWKHVN